MIETVPCRLCGSEQVEQFFSEARRSYLRCCNCALVYVPPRYYLSREEERVEYDLHRNDVDDPGYRHFLSRLAEPLRQRLYPSSRGLDFGCGPAPALAAMLGESGFEVSLYDSFYYPDSAALQGPYDFICATEVAEHLHHPGLVLEQLWSALRPGACLGIMTKLVLDRDAFSRWHYKNDPTHVCFFSADTWHWWAEAHSSRAQLIGADVILLDKPRD
jgi:SAM-dependent methyltransferase